jgi:hypothetical protein
LLVHERSSKYYVIYNDFNLTVFDGPSNDNEIACEQGSGLGSIGFRVLFILLGFSLRDFAAHSDGASPADVGVVFICIFWTAIVLYYYYYYFILL